MIIFVENTKADCLHSKPFKGFFKILIGVLNSDSDKKIIFYIVLIKIFKI
jgi:hypothetical protein